MGVLSEIYLSAWLYTILVLQINFNLTQVMLSDGVVLHFYYSFYLLLQDETAACPPGIVDN